MKQLLQYQKTGELYIDEVPEPVLRDGFVLVRTHFSAISVGTERTSVATAQANLIRKARMRPDLVRQVMQNVRREGIRATYQKVQNRLDAIKPLGYSAAGIVIDSSSDSLRIGDHVACAGGGYASHAEIISVPQNLCVLCPPEVKLDEAALVTLGAIALQGIRVAGIEPGSTVGVIGLGLLGQLTAQLLRAMGCSAIGFDINDFAVAHGQTNGAVALRSDRPETKDSVFALTSGRGVDAVLITAGTSSNIPIEFAGEVTRDRAVIVIVGAVKTDIPRSPFYEKELSVRFSRSYGPGRYDPAYEEYGLDYPLGYVRWTEQRNMETVVRLLAERRLDFGKIITHRFPFHEATTAYRIITGEEKTRCLGIVLQYSEMLQTPTSISVEHRAPSASRKGIGVTFIGAGNFAQSVLLPPLKRIPGVFLDTVATIDGAAAASVSRKFGFATATTESDSALRDTSASLIFVATRHDSHARYVTSAVRAGKAVFVEKPLAVNEAQLQEVISAVTEEHGRLMVGYNRRFSAPIRRIKEFFGAVQEPLSIIYRVNAGCIPPTSWVQDPQQGGRIIGEACHFIDVMQYLTGAEPVRISALAHRSKNRNIPDADVMTLTIAFSDGAIGTVHYFANGDSRLDKEYLEVYGQGMTAIMNNFTLVECYASGKRSRQKYNGQKGHTEEIAATIDALRGGGSMPIPFESIVRTTRTTFCALESLRTGTAIGLSEWITGTR